MPRSKVAKKDKLEVYTIGVFISVPILSEYIAEFQKNNSCRVLTSSANFKEALTQARIWRKQGVDVFVSRRGTGDYLRKNMSSPVLTLPMSEMEIINCFRECPRGTVILMPVFGEIYSGLNPLEELIGIDILQHVYSSYEELEKLIHQGKLWNIDYVAGGGTTKYFAQKYGIPFIFLEPAREQFISLLDSAAHVASLYHEKESMINEMQGIIDSMIYGFISIDSQGIILACNNVALTLLEQTSDDKVIGTSIFPYIPESIIQKILNNPQVNCEEIIKINNTQLIINANIVTSRNNTVKVLLSLRNIHDVIRQSSSIRSVISKGFEARYRLSDMIHKSTQIHDIITLCRIYAKNDSSVLICGETGTGKEIIAQGIHTNSKRKKSPFVSVNCAELPEHLLESELFGYDEGAFTGSRKGGKAGFFELAHGGTLLLDEIDSASTLVQSKLLRVLQEKEVMRIGGKRKIPINVRVLATSGHDLWQAVCRSLFRKDLFFRLNVMSVYIPSLQQRIDDIDALFPHFIQLFSKRENILPPTYSIKQLQLLKQYSWPGNIRQLRNFAQRFVIYSSFMKDAFALLYNELHRTVSPQNYPMINNVPNYTTLPDIHHISPENIVPPPQTSFPHTINIDKSHHYHSDEKKYIQEVLQSVRYSKQEAAKILNMSRSTLWRKLRQYGIE